MTPKKAKSVPTTMKVTEYRSKTVGTLITVATDPG